MVDYPNTLKKMIWVILFFLPIAILGWWVIIKWKTNYEVYKSKYRNVKYVDENGVKWDSKKEYKRYLELKDRENKKEISNIQRQVTYQVMPRLTDENGKFKYHPIKYVADFVYTDNATGKQIVEDAKGIKTEVYKIKKKLMYWQYKIEIKEV